jgi:ATP-binding cassette subfamily B protein
VVIDQGKIVAQGTHEELMREDSLYAKLAKLQFDTGREALTVS